MFTHMYSLGMLLASSQGELEASQPPEQFLPAEAPTSACNSWQLRVAPSRSVMILSSSVHTVINLAGGVADTGTLQQNSWRPWLARRGL